jgi:hypothetical protein
MNPRLKQKDIRYVLEIPLAATGGYVYGCSYGDRNGAAEQSYRERGQQQLGDRNANHREQ